jgi:uncharacterized protein YfaT (DUF1175 family)
MNKKSILRISLIIVIISITISIIPIQNKVIYYPKILEKSSSLKIEMHYFNLMNLQIPLKSKVIEFFFDEKSKKLVMESNPDSITYDIKFENSTFLIGLKDHSKKYELTLPVIHFDEDKDDDGFPDYVELDNENDRSNFRKWFCTIALTQFYHFDDRWKDRDCAGLIRFCTREALKIHDNKWLSEKKLLYDINIPDVKKYNYPNVPLLGDKIFRIEKNSGEIIDSSNISKYFSDFAEAKYLISYNYDFISKDVREILPGDVLFFMNENNLEWPYHCMIFLGSDIISEKNIGDFVIYHTGSNIGNEGIIKKLSLSELNKHPNQRWHPVKSNPYFLGFYRWKLLN